MINNFGIEITDISHGWAAMRVEIGPYSRVFQASSVFHDSIGLLARAAILLSRGSDVEEVPINEEPDEFSLEFLRRGDSVSVGLTQHSGRPAKSGLPQALAQQNYQLRQVQTAVRDAFLQLAACVPEDEFVRQWKYPFPARHLAEMAAW